MMDSAAPAFDVDVVVTVVAAVISAGPPGAQGAEPQGRFRCPLGELNENEAPSQPARFPDASAPAVVVAAEPAATYGAAERPAEPPEAVLIVNLRERRVSYRGHEIRTGPPNSLQRQPLLALAVPAGSPGEVMTTAELAEGMFKLGGLRKWPRSRDARDLRYKLLRPFKKALIGEPASSEIEQLVESVPVSACD